MNKLEPCAWILSGVLELRTCGMRLPCFNTADVKNTTEGCYAHVQCRCVLMPYVTVFGVMLCFQDIALESMNRYVSPINPAVFPHLSIVLLGIGIFFMAWFFVYPLQQFAKEILFGEKNLENNNLPQPPFKSSRFLGNCKLRLGSFSRIVPHFTVRCFEFHQC